jgi:uncharacterized protein (DUF488 family)
MCAEALWWKCHRRLISDYFTQNGAEVIHIFDKNKTEIHILKNTGEPVQKELFG